MLAKKAFYITINQVATLSLWTYGMTVMFFLTDFSPDSHAESAFKWKFPRFAKTQNNQKELEIVTQMC